jgi:hypothetical protein
MLRYACGYALATGTVWYPARVAERIATNRWFVHWITDDVGQRRGIGKVQGLIIPAIIGFVTDQYSVRT